MIKPIKVVLKYNSILVNSGTGKTLQQKKNFMILKYLSDIYLYLKICNVLII